jgi:hypothetical protein
LFPDTGKKHEMPGCYFFDNSLRGLSFCSCSIITSLTYLSRWTDKANTVEEFALLADTAAHDQNHKVRRALSGKTACQSYFNENRMRYSKRQRKGAYRWIRDLVIDISLKAGKNAIGSLAWRIAAKNWLVENKLITIVKDGKVLPYFSSNLCHD